MYSLVLYLFIRSRDLREAAGIQQAENNWRQLQWKIAREIMESDYSGVAGAVLPDRAFLGNVATSCVERSIKTIA